MIAIDVAVQVALISGLSGGLVSIIIKILSSSLEKSEASGNDADAAKALSESARVQVETYGKAFVDPLKDRVEALEGENGTLRSLLVDSQERYDLQRRSHNEQIESLQLQIKNLTTSVNNQRDQIVFLIEQGETKDKTIQRMQEEIDQLRRENRQLRDQIESLRTENALLKTQPVGGG